MTIRYDVLVTAPYDREEEADEVVRQLRNLGLLVCYTRTKVLRPHNWQDDVRDWSRQSLLRVALAPTEGHDRLHTQDSGWRNDDLQIYKAFVSRAHAVFYTSRIDWILGYLLGFLEVECRAMSYKY